jgi:tRNA modification GTPase
MIRLIDVAGISEIEQSNDIERQMHEQALKTLRAADRVVLVQEPGDRTPLNLGRAPDLVVNSKAELLTPSPCTQGEGGGEGSSRHCEKMHPLPNPLPAYREREQEVLRVSVHTGQNMNLLRHRLDELAFGTSTTSTLAINARHTQAIQVARQSLDRARNESTGPELLASDLRDALDSLGEILGQVTPDDVLGRIFSTFCIGK